MIPEHGTWEIVSRPPEPALRPYVRDYAGYVENIAGVLRRRELPSGDVIVIVNLGAPLSVGHPRDTTLALGAGQGFVAGLHDSWAITEAVGMQRGVEVRLTPIGAHLIFGLPMHAISNRVVPLGDLLGPATGRLVERLQAAPSWECCFDLLEAQIRARIAAAHESSPSVASGRVAHAWRRLVDTAGSLDVGALADELACSKKHLIAQFREQIGLPPKTVARIIRFGHAIGRLDALGEAGWAEIALDAGYYDQAHLIRDFRQFTGATPRNFLARRYGDSPRTLVEPPA